MKTICVIPAKKHSERIPGKNTRDFLGAPVINYSLALAKAFGFGKVVVSSDSDYIGGLAAKMGAQYFKRSGHTCRDDSPIVEAVLEVLHYVSYDMETDYVCVLYPVAPFARFNDLLAGFERLKQGAHPVVYPVYPAREVPERCVIRRGETVMPRHPEYTETNSQYFEPTYHSAGQWYWADLTWLLTHRTLTPLEAGCIEIEQSRAVDIDTPADWAMAELMYLHEHFPVVTRELLSRVAGISHTEEEAAGAELVEVTPKETACGGTEVSP